MVFKGFLEWAPKNTTPTPNPILLRPQSCLSPRRPARTLSRPTSPSPFTTPNPETLIPNHETNPQVSGKDLIQNHLTFSLYNHVAVWGEDKDRLPRSFRCDRGMGGD